MDDTFEFQGKRWRVIHSTAGLHDIRANMVCEEIPPEKPDALGELDKEIDQIDTAYFAKFPCSHGFAIRENEKMIARATVNAALKMAEEKINDVNRCHLELHDMCIRRMNQLEARIAALERKTDVP